LGKLEKVLEPKKRRTACLCFSNLRNSYWNWFSIICNEHSAIKGLTGRQMHTPVLVENVPFGGFRNCFSWKKSILFIVRICPVAIKKKENLLPGVNCLLKIDLGKNV